MIVKRIAALLMCLVLLAGLPAAAFAAEAAKWDTNGEMNIIDSDELEGIIEGFVEENNLTGKNFSVGYCYTATGDSWYYNGDEWYYSASLYKVPLMMIYAEKVHKGELEQSDKISGMPLDLLEEYVLVNSSNDYGHLAMDYLGGDYESRLLYRQFSSLPEDEYDPDFYDYSYFTARFMTDVMMTLYYEQDRFPNVMDCLLRAQPETHFNASVGQQYDVAQKYGSYELFNHAAGVIYAEQPYVLVVMTENVSNYLEIIARCASVMDNYTLSLNEKLAGFEQELEQEQEQQALAEQERLAEEQRLEEEAQRLAAEEQQRLEEEAARLAEEAAQKERLKQIGITAAIAALVLAAMIVLMLMLRKRRQRAAVAAGDAARRKRDEASARDYADKSKYTPRH